MQTNIATGNHNTVPNSKGACPERERSGVQNPCNTIAALLIRREGQMNGGWTLLTTQGMVQKDQ